MAETGATSVTATARDNRQAHTTAKGLPLQSPRVLASILALSATTLMAEVFLPAGVWAAALHLSLVFLGIWLARPRDVYVLAAIASALVVAGAVLTARGASASALLETLVSGPGLANRLIVLLAIWALAAVVAGSKRREAALRARLAKEAAHRKAMEAELDKQHAVPRPSALDDRVWEDQDLGHEIRTLLNAIVGFSEAAKGEIFGPISDTRYRDYLGHINESGWTLLRVFERHLASEPLPDKPAEPGTRRTQGEKAAPGTDPSARAVNE